MAPPGFAELKRRAGLESSGNLQFHLRKLDGMVRAGPTGDYSLTDEGKEALRIIASVNATSGPKRVLPEGRVPVRRSLLAVLVTALLLASSVAIYQELQINSLQGLPTGHSTTTQPPPTTSTVCIILGQPGPFFLRVVSDSDQSPLVGATVAATNEPALCNGVPATSQTTTTFTTSDTGWYSLVSENDGGYSLLVNYSGQSYSFIADLRPVSVTCATLYIPSGMTNVTITEFQTTCP
jgi:hypothetical protein